MELATYRRREGKTLEQAATELGLRSKGRISDLERGVATPSIRLALQIEDWSAGELDATALLSPDDAELLRRAFARRQQAAGAAA